MLECLNQIIGLSTSNCACYQDDRPVDFDQSLSGLFISDDFGLNLNFTNSAADCEQGGLWDILTRARTSAIRDFLADFSAKIQMSKNYRYMDFNGEIGLRKYNTITPDKRPIIGLQIEPRCYEQTNLVLNSVWLNLRGFTGTLDVDVFVYSNEDLNTPLGQTTVQLTTVDTFTKADFATPIVLDLSPKIHNTYYYVVFEMPAGASLINNKIDEGCGCNKDYFKREYAFKNFAHIVGVQADSFAGLDSQKITSSYANGMLLDASAGCDYLGQLCDLAKTLLASTAANRVAYNGKYYHLGRSLAATIGHKAAYIVADKIIKTRNVNRVSLLDREVMYGVRSQNATNYEASLEFLVENLPDEYTACFTCKPSSFSSVNSII